MSGQLTAHADVALAGLQVVDGADVVQASTGHIVPRGGVGAGHHPGGAQGDGMDLADTGGGPQEISGESNLVAMALRLLGDRGSIETRSRVPQVARGRKERFPPSVHLLRVLTVHTGTRRRS